MIIVYGITNCTTVQKSRKWLEDHKIDYEFHDYKKLGIDQTHLRAWCDKFGWEQVLNRQGMMWRKASESDKQKVVDTQSAIEFMIKVPNSIKRPMIEKDSKVILRGFEVGEYERIWG
jgi:Spx/MgsR family transcriptional regulator